MYFEFSLITLIGQLSLAFLAARGRSCKGSRYTFKFDQIAITKPTSRDMSGKIAPLYPNEASRSCKDGCSACAAALLAQIASAELTSQLRPLMMQT